VRLIVWVSMGELLLHNARIVLERSVERGDVLIRGDRIAQVFIGDRKPIGLSGIRLLDLGDAYLAPGLNDIHIHGSAGVDLLDADQGEIAVLSRFLLSEGITGYFATLVPTDERTYTSAIAAINSYIERQDEKLTGARLLGIHFEGPFVNENRCGALQPRHFRTYDGDPRSLELFLQGCKTLMTLAPEISGGIDLVRELVFRGVRVFIGHTQADPETLDIAAEAGARHITHFPNALDPLHHRKPGAVCWGLLRSDVSIDCIADFHHVHPLMLRLMYQSKGADRMALISDAILATGLGDGEYIVWGDRIAVRNGRTALIEGPSAGTIAGSVITMRTALKNIISLGIPVHEAILMASLVPARAAGIDSECGSITEGKRADLVVFDEEFNVRLVVSGGEVALRE
jgi:N-acetylglucosamine-6-phosphate deacetylase